jgi:MerC mercury resistance protein
MISAAAPPKNAPWLDLAAIGLSGLCIVHCLGATLLIGLLSSSLVATVWHHEAVHLGLLLLATPLTIWTLVRGLSAHGNRWPLLIGILGLKLMALALLFRAHASLEMWVTLAGVALLAAAHMMNLRLHTRRAKG